MTEATHIEPPPPPPPEAALTLPEQPMGIAARVCEKINDLTNLPYDLLARWKTREPGSAQALLDHAGPLGKLVSSVAEKAQELIEQIGHEHVVGIYRIGVAAVKGVLILKGIDISTGSGGANTHPITQQDADDQFMAKATGAAKATLDLNAPIAKEAVHLEAQSANSAPGAADPAVNDYEVHLPEWNGKTGEGSIWFALNDKEKGIASLLGYDELTEKQKWQLTDYVLKENGLSWKEAAKIDEFTMPSHGEIEAKLEEIGATYNPEADKRDSRGGGLGGEGSGQPPPPPPPAPIPPPQPEPTQSQQPTQAPPSPSSAAPSIPAAHDPGADGDHSPTPPQKPENNSSEGLTTGQEILGGIALGAAVSVLGAHVVVAHKRHQREDRSRANRIPPDKLAGRRNRPLDQYPDQYGDPFDDDEDNSENRPTGEDLADERTIGILKSVIRGEVSRQRLPRITNLDEMTIDQLRDRLRTLRTPPTDPDF